MEEQINDEGECVCCCEDITDDIKCLYSTDENPDTWLEAKYCYECVLFLRSCRFKNYIKAIENSDCAKELGGLIRAGPPVWIVDGGLPVSDGETVRWVKSIDGEPETAKYDGAPTGEAHRQLWDMCIAVVQPCIDAQKLDQAVQIMEAEERIMRQKMERLKLESEKE